MHDIKWAVRKRYDAPCFPGVMNAGKVKMAIRMVRERGGRAEKGKEGG